MFKTPRGMRDVGPLDFARLDYVCGKIKKILQGYGFQFVSPTALEGFDTLAAKSGEEIENELYVFKDKSGRKIGLRFDLTVGIARMVANSNYPRPIKLACISNMWRYDRPQFARYREFWQWDAEILGCSGIEADAEIISVICDILDSFGLKYEMKISNRRLIEGFLLSSGVKQKDVLPVLRIIDKSSKISEKEFLKELKKYTKNTDRILRLINMKKVDIDAIRAENDLTKQGKKELLDLLAALKAFGKADKCSVDLSVVRGIDYYTGLVYEAWIKSDETKKDAKGVKQLGAVAGGGRYDDLMKIYGKEMPATGVAGGLERLILSLKDLPIGQVPKALVIYVNDSVFNKAVEITQELRKSVSASIDLSKRSLSKQLDYANKLGVEKVVIIGPKELAANKAKIRDMKTGKEKEVELDKLKQFINQA